MKKQPQKKIQSDFETTCPPQMPLIGDKAPAFEAETTKGLIRFPDDYQGRWVILFSHPADFTPVCTTEFIMFANLLEDFKHMNAELIGLSVDSLSSHIAWLYAIEQEVNFNGHKNVKIDFPLIADLSTTIARKYGMLHPSASTTKAVRAVFFIDPNGIVRTILYYPASTGRNFSEIKRILSSLQLTDTYGVSTPANWWPGDDVIVPNPSTLEEAVAAYDRNAKSTEVWFLSLQPMTELEEKKTTTSQKKSSKTISKNKKSTGKR